MDTPHQVMPDVEVLPAHFPILGMGFLPVNAFVIKAKEPILVDTGMGIDSEEFMQALGSVIDPKDLKWIWLTHDDADHTGNLRNVLEAAPDARLAVHSLAALRLSTVWAVPMHRVYWLNSGESITAGDRKLTAVRPPLFDNPTTIGMYDGKSQAFFSADCFGAIIPSPAQNADDVAEGDLARGMTNWASCDSPWVHFVAPEVFNRELSKVRQMAPKAVFSAHLPPAQGRTEQFMEWLSSLPTSTPFVAPNQAALEQILAQTKSAG
jgi:flavorubredoxin